MEKLDCPGFKAGGIAAGIKKTGARDLGILYSELPASAAAVFTRNAVQAACVTLNKEKIRSGKARAIVVNSGNANCCTGERGMNDARATAAFAATALDLPKDEVLVASTGVIGQYLPMEKIESAVPALVECLAEDGFSDFAESILTTDKISKMVACSGKIDGRRFQIMGVAKGSGMIRPDMATMLCFVVTDAAVSPDLLTEMLRKAVARSFNRITVDGDTSTNDMVVLLANGRSGVDIESPDTVELFQKKLDLVLHQLAVMIVKDGEGATKLVEIVVQGARSENDARAVADTVANSNLVKTAFFGEDANWGRIIAAVGRAGIPLQEERIDIRFDDVLMVANGLWCGMEAEKAATAVLKKPEFCITIDLKQGNGASSVLTCDFSTEYVAINADYRS